MTKKIWVGVVRDGCGQSVQGTLKLTVSQEWIDGMSWFFAYWCKFRKARSYFNDFWVGVFKNGHGRVVCETLKSAEWLSWFFACILWWNNFWLDQHCTLCLWLLSVSLLQLSGPSSSLLPVIIAHNHLLFFKIFSNFVNFFPNFQIFCPF